MVLSGRILASAMIACFLIAGPAKSGPDEVTRFFMNDRVSMLDWGIFQLANGLDGQGDRPSGWVSYNYDDNTIEIIDGKNFDDSFGQSELNAACRDWFRKVRSQALVNPNTGKPFLEASQYTDYFTHSGYINGTQEDHDLRLAELDKRFRLIFYARGSDYTVRLKCTGALLASGFASEVME